MLSNIANHLTNAVSRNPITTKQATLVKTPVEWPADCTIAGEPLFTTHLTEDDFNFLEESAGLGPPSWWLDPTLASQDPCPPSGPTYEDEVALTAWLRAPLEQTGPIRDASRRLLDRLNEVERLQALAVEETERKLRGRGKRVRHHSTLQLAGSTEDLQGVDENAPAVTSPLQRRETYAMHKNATGRPTAAPGRHFLPPPVNANGGSRPPVSPRFCKSPERRPLDYRIEGSLHRTYSKNSLERLHTGVEDLQRATHFPPSVRSATSTQLLGRTYDAEELSDVFPSPRASTETFDPKAATRPPPPPPLPTPSANLPQAGPARHYTFTSPQQQQQQQQQQQHRQPLLNTSGGSAALALAMQEEANLRASVSKRSGGLNSLRDSGASADGGGVRLQRGNTLVSSRSPARLPLLSGSLPIDQVVVQHKSSAPTLQGATPGATQRLRTSLPNNPLKTSTGSGSNIHVPTNMTDTMEMIRRQEEDLRVESSVIGCLGNVSLTNSLERGSRESGLDRLNKSLNNIEEAEGRRFQPRDTGPKDIPARYERKKSTGNAMAGASSTGDLSSDASLKTMDSLLAAARDQEEALRASGEEVLKKSRSKSSLNRSIDSMRNFSDSGSENRGLSPQPSATGPTIHQSSDHPPSASRQSAAALRDSKATYDVGRSRDVSRVSVNSMRSLGAASPPRQSGSSPVRLRRSSRANVPPPLALPIDTTDAITPETPNTATTMRPSSYTEQLQIAKHASSAVDAWVNDTLEVVAENPSVALSFTDENQFTTASTDDYSVVRDSRDTYVLPEDEATVASSKPVQPVLKRPTTISRPTGLPRPTTVLRPPNNSRLVKPPINSPTQRGNIMTDSSQTLKQAVAPPAASGGAAGTATQRSLAPKAIPSGRTGLARGSTLRPPAAATSTVRLRNPAGSGAIPPASLPRLIPPRGRGTTTGFPTVYAAPTRSTTLPTTAARAPTTASSAGGVVLRRGVALSALRGTAGPPRGTFAARSLKPPQQQQQQQQPPPEY